MDLNETTPVDPADPKKSKKQNTYRRSKLAKISEQAKVNIQKRWDKKRKMDEASTIPLDTEDRYKAKAVTFDYDYIMSAPQQEFAEAIARGARVVLFLGGIRGGKTYAGAREALKQIYLYNRLPNLGWIVSPTYPMSTVPEREFRAAAGDLVARHLKGERAFLMMPPSKMPNYYYRVEVKSAEDPDRLRGPSLGWIWIDEGAMVTEECFNILLGRVLDSKGVVFITTTPRGMNWLYEKVARRADPNDELYDPRYAVVRAPTLTNHTLDPREVESLRSRYTGEFARQELDADFLTFQGLVYKDYRPNIHFVKPGTFDDVPENAHIVCGVDFGYNDPFVCLWLGKWDGVWHLLDEHYQSLRTMDYHEEVLRNHPLAKRVQKYWGDPSAAQIRGDMRMHGFNILPAIKQMDSNQSRWITAGIQEVTRWFSRRGASGTPMIKIWRNCIQTNKELGEYRYREERDRNAGERPQDVSNHAMDALRYALYSESRINGGLSAMFQTESGTMERMRDSKDNLRRDLEFFYEKEDAKFYKKSHGITYPDFW